MAKKPNASSDSLGKKTPRDLFLDNYDALSSMLSASINTLTPHFISARILTVLDQEEIMGLANPSEKAMVVLKKISAALENNFCKSFRHMLSVMHIYGNTDMKDLSQNIIALLPNQTTAVALVQDKTQQVKHNTPDNASIDFSAVVFDIAEILDELTTGKVDKFKSLCYGLTINDQLFFSMAEKDAIRACKTFHALFSEIHRSMRWDSHQLLDRIIFRVGLPEATAKLEQFKKKIDWQIKLKNFYDSCLAKDGCPPDGYTEMVAIVNKDYTQIMVGDYKEIEDFLSTHLGGLPPPKHGKHLSVQFTWYIPISAVPLLLQKAYHAREFFILQPTIVYISIAGVMIWDKNATYSPQTVKTREEEIVKMKQEVVELTGKIDQCNLNLKTAQDDVAAKEKTNKKLQDSLKKTKDEANKVPKLQEQIQELSAKVTESQDREKSLDEELKRNKTEFEEKEKQIDKLNEKLKVLRSARDDLQKDFDAKNYELSDVMTKAKERLDELTTEKEKLEIDYAELQKTNKGTLTDKDVLIKELQAKNTELISAIDEGKKEADSIQQDLDKVNAEQSKLESECSKLQKINAEIKSNEGKLIDAVERKTKELSRVQEELLEHQKAKQLDSLPTSLPMEANNPAQGKIIQRLREQVRSLTQERNKLTDQIKLLQQPKEFDSGLGVSIPNSQRSSELLLLDSGIGPSRPTTGEQPYVPRDS